MREPVRGRILTILVRCALACLTLLWDVAILSADEKGTTHPVRPAELPLLIGQADKIVVYGGAGIPYSALYSSTDPKDISDLGKALTVAPPTGWFRCACIPALYILLSRKGAKLGAIDIQADLTIGFSPWSGDAIPADKEKFLRWFDKRGITGPRRSIEEKVAREKVDRLASKRWLSAMPPALRPLWAKLMQDSQWWTDPSSAVITGTKALQPLLAKEFPDSQQRIRTLFSWFGSGAGPWSGFPVHEEVAAQLLLEHPPRELISALKRKPLTDLEMEGAARLFSVYAPGVPFRTAENKTLILLIPAELKKVLFEHVLKAGDQDNIDRAREVFEKN